ncbi:MAG: rod shape-determining protein RodA, partial [Methyloprofundus sp.]|nr:rod shape-determining protein RodA [Methyloprofundus sp.]
MMAELRDEQFKEHTLVGNFLRKLHLDIPLLLGLFVLLVLSFMMLYSTGNKETALLVRQAVRMGIAAVLMVGLAHVNPRQFQRYSIALYCFGVILLAAVLLFGDMGKGAQRWLDLGFFR